MNSCVTDALFLTLIMEILPPLKKISNFLQNSYYRGSTLTSCTDIYFFSVHFRYQRSLHLHIKFNLGVLLISKVQLKQH